MWIKGRMAGEKSTNHKHPVCPACKEYALVPILYGPLPDSLAEDRDRGDVVWGGYAKKRGSPRWKCSACGRTFGAKDV